MSVIPQKSSDTMPEDTCISKIRQTYTDLRTAHGQPVAEEVARVCDKNDETGLDFGIFVQARMLEHE